MGANHEVLIQTYDCICLIKGPLMCLVNSTTNQKQQMLVFLTISAINPSSLGSSADNRPRISQ